MYVAEKRSEIPSADMRLSILETITLKSMTTIARSAAQRGSNYPESQASAETGDRG